MYCRRGNTSVWSGVVAYWKDGNMSKRHLVAVGALASVAVALPLAPKPASGAAPEPGRSSTGAAAAVRIAGQMGHVCHRGYLCLHMHYPNGTYHWLDLSACRWHRFEYPNFPTWYVDNQTGYAEAVFRYEVGGMASPSYDGSVYWATQVPGPSDVRGAVPYRGGLGQATAVKPCGADVKP